MKKEHRNWIIGISVVAVVLIIFFFIFNSGNKTVCNYPYIQVGENCCLDENSNRVCDNDEQSGKEEVSRGPYCGDGICQSNEQAPDCNDCKAKIRIDNLKYEILKPEGQYKELAITSYDVTQLGDEVAVYPGIDVYTGYSEQECQSKSAMFEFKKNFDCPGGCYYMIDNDKKGKSYREDGTQLESPWHEDPICIYFIFFLKAYPEGGVSAYQSETAKRLDTWESSIMSV